jgi:hypothetical protein
MGDGESRGHRDWKTCASTIVNRATEAAGYATIKQPKRAYEATRCGRTDEAHSQPADLGQGNGAD